MPDGQEPGDDMPMDPNPTPPVERCTTNGLQMCIDFEDDPIITDAFGASTQATNVMSVMRSELEKAAEWMGQSWIQVANNAKLDNTNYTIELWTKPSMLPPKMGEQQAGLFDVNFQYQMNLEWDGAVECRFFDITRTNDDNADSKIKIMPNGQWHHVACTYDKHQLRVYVDGKLSGCRDSTKSVNTTDTTGAAIGANINYGPAFRNKYVGDLDNVHLYNRALSPAEICDAWGYGNCSSDCPE